MKLICALSLLSVVSASTEDALALLRDREDAPSTSTSVGISLVNNDGTFHRGITLAGAITSGSLCLDDIFCDFSASTEESWASDMIACYASQLAGSYASGFYTISADLEGKFVDGQITGIHAAAGSAAASASVAFTYSGAETSAGADVGADVYAYASKGYAPKFQASANAHADAWGYAESTAGAASGSISGSGGASASTVSVVGKDLYDFYGSITLRARNFNRNVADSETYTLAEAGAAAYAYAVAQACRIVRGSKKGKWGGAPGLDCDTDYDEDYNTAYKLTEDYGFAVAGAMRRLRISVNFDFHADSRISKKTGSSEIHFDVQSTSNGAGERVGRLRTGCDALGADY